MVVIWLSLSMTRILLVLLVMLPQVTLSLYAKVYVRKNKSKGSDMVGPCGPDTGVGLLTNKKENMCKVRKAI